MGITALFGGSFDPVHCGHMALAKQVLSSFDVGKFYFVPASISPLKRGAMTASDEDRLEMLRLAIAGDDRLLISTIELDKGGVSYTVDTLREWKRQNPDDAVIFLCGMDSLLSLHRWKDWGEILKLCRFVTYMRPGYDNKPSADDLNLPIEVADRLLTDVMVGDFLDISSSEIRQRISAGEDITPLVPKGVAEYIRSKAIYKDPATIVSGVS